MYRFFLFLKKVGFVLLFVAIEGFALRYFAESSSYNQGKMINAGNFLVGDIYTGINRIKHYFSLGRENRLLNEQIAALHRELQQARESGGGEPSDSAASRRGEIPYLFSTARVGNNSIVRQKNYITLDKGLRDGVRPDMGVLAGGGIVGYVVNSSDRFSVAISILNTDFRTSGKIAGRDYTGSISWDGLRTDEVVFSEVVKYAPLEVGDTIVTTDFSSFFPPDIPIGTVKSFELINGTYYQARLRLIAEPGALNRVVLVDYRDRDEKLELHSVMVLQDGNVLFEKWFGEHGPTVNHSMRSVSKTWVMTAIGFAIAEGKIAETDKVISFFPDDLPAEVSENLAAMTIRDLLMMATGHDQDTWPLLQKTEERWEKVFFATPIVHKPGTKFLYNSGASYMLASIIRKTTGENVLDYLKPRFLEPLGIEGIEFEANWEGTSKGGAGMSVKTEDMAKLGLFLLQKGQWQGKQLLPAAWIEEASKRQIMQNPKVNLETNKNDWENGYCYQMWRSCSGGFRADGAAGQFILVEPELNAVVVLTSQIPDVRNMQEELDLVWKILLPALKTAKKDSVPSAE